MPLTPVAKKWVQALRSGKYAQGPTVLRHINQYCCLGVLCEIAVEDGIIPPSVPDRYGRAIYGTTICLLPSQLLAWSGLSTSDGRFWGKETQNSLVELNDAGYSFSKIADIIESEPKGLFS